jgi:hypothetical protein
VFVELWFDVPPVEVRQCEGCGEATPAPWHAALLRQVGANSVPAKSVPWQIWQAYMLELPGPRFAEAPCCWVAEPEATHPETVPW